MQKLTRRALALAAALIVGTALALPPTINYDLPVSLDTGPKGAPLTTILEALAHTADATLLMQEIPDVTVKYAIPGNRSVREVWELLTNLHGLEYHMHDDTTILVAPPEVLARFKPQARAPELVDAFYNPGEDADVAAALIAQRFDATAAAFPNRNVLLVTATQGEQEKIAAFLQRLEENLTLPSETPQQAGAGQTESPEATREEQAASEASDGEPTSLQFYDLGSDYVGFLAILAQQHPNVTAQALNDEGLIAVTATAALHDEIAAYRSEYVRALNLARANATKPEAERAYSLVNQDAEEAAEQLAASLGADADLLTITPNPRTNSILVRGEAEAVTAAARILQAIDQRVPQVLLTMKVTEITETEAERLGINLAGSIGALAVNIVSGGLDLVLNPFQGINNIGFTAALEALEEQNLARTVDELSIRVNHNQEATFNSGGQVQVALIEDEVTTLDFGSLLTVKPLISPDGSITLNIKSTLSDFVGNLSGLSGLRINQRDLSTTVTFQEGETVVLGGVLRNSVSLTTSGVPVLKDLPIIGGLFRTTEQGEERTDYVVIIQADLLD